MDYTFYLFLLLSASTGARVSETRAICFQKSTFKKTTLNRLSSWEEDMIMRVR